MPARAALVVDNELAVQPRRVEHIWVGHKACETVKVVVVAVSAKVSATHND